MIIKGLKDYEKHSSLEDYELNEEWDCGYLEACKELLKFIEKNDK